MATLIKFAGKELSIAGWNLETGIPYNALYNRYRAGWSAERMLTTPIKDNTNHGGNKPTVYIMFEGKNRCSSEVAKMTGWPVQTVRYWIRTGQEIKIRHKEEIEVIDENMSVEELTLNNMLASLPAHEIKRRAKAVIFAT